MYHPSNAKVTICQSDTMPGILDENNLTRYSFFCEYFKKTYFVTNSPKFSLTNCWCQQISATHVLLLG